MKTTTSAPATLYLVRHGTTAWNQELRYQGLTDNPLDEIGEKQGALLSGYFENIKIDLGVTSPLQRAARTLQFCLSSQEREVPVLVDSCVAELDLGSADGLTREEVRDRYPEFYRAYIQCDDRGHAVSPNGESMVHCYNRIVSGIQAIVREHPGETIVIASHGSVLQCFLNYAKGVPVEEMKRVQLCNVSVSCVEMDGEGNARLLFAGDKHHIPDELQFSYGGPQA